MQRVIRLTVFGLALILASLPADAETLIEIDNIRSGDLEVVGFELTKGGEVDIEAVGIRQQHGGALSAYAWILDSETRQPVWVMKSRFADRHRRGTALRKTEKVMSLDPGKYELYYYAGERWYSGFDIDGARDFIGFLGYLADEDHWDDYYGRDDYWDIDDMVRDCYVRLSSDDITRSDLKEFNVTGKLPGALLTYNQLGDDEYIRQGFSLKKDGKLRIYSIIEHVKGYRTAADYCWIMDANTREKMWESDRFSTERAGGGRKNRMFDDQIELKKGEYVLHFVTDGSHSYDEFNDAPPYDPFNWGITILPGDNFNPSDFELTEAPGLGKPLIDMTRARDDDYNEQPFRLTKETNLQILALGEYDFGDREFCDYGWIMKAGTGEIVWEMTRRNTDHAGGAEKNLMFDGTVKLPAGDYIAGYVTDGSHSYRDWNDRQPYDPTAWGLAIYSVKDSDASGFQKLSQSDLKKNSNVLVSLTRVRDHERVRDRFTLDKETRVHIYAIGEGDRDEMYDYGWIEDDRTGRAVWEMTWRNTDHAGGAKKNRVFQDDILLDEGTYEVYYITDGSHSFNDWNSRRPRDPQNWGITVSLPGAEQAKR